MLPSWNAASERVSLIKLLFVGWEESDTGTEHRSSAFCFAHPGAEREEPDEGASMLPMGNGAARGDAEGSGKCDAAGGEWR